MTRDDILSGVRTCVASSLDIPADPIREDDRLIGDLGADSLDLLDLTFGLEQHFKIRVSPRDIERRAAAGLGGAPMEVDGVYTPEAMDELRRSMPEVPPDELPDGMHQAQLPKVFRIATMVNLVSRLLDEQASGQEETNA